METTSHLALGSVDAGSRLLCLHFAFPVAIAGYVIRLTLVIVDNLRDEKQDGDQGGTKG